MHRGEFAGMLDLCGTTRRYMLGSHVMEATEICRLTEKAVAKLLARRGVRVRGKKGKGRRLLPRWPFPGTVELWIPQDDQTERYELATSLNLSLRGVGIRCDEPLTPGLELAVAIHEPEVSFHGRAVARHCTEMEDDYLVGLEFLFDAA